MFRGTPGAKGPGEELRPAQRSRPRLVPEDPAHLRGGAGGGRGWGVTRDGPRAPTPPPAIHLAMVLLPLRCLFWGSLLTTVYPEPRTACREKQYLVDSQCCNMCPPGEKLVNDCLHTIDTECTRCQTGEFLDTWNAERHCHQHKYCDPNLGLHVEKEGTSETDTTCTCDEGLHCTNAACESCTMHSLCPPGLGVKQIATGVSDTVCDPCPIGFFSNVSSALEKCHPWTSCETKGLVKVQAGTNKTDVICGPQPRIRALVVIPIMMGVLLVVLLLSACIRESPGKVVKKPENKVMCQDPVEDLEEFPMPPHSIAPVQETLHGCQPVTQEDGKESRISVQERV